MAERVEVLEIDLTDIQTEAQETGQTLKELRAEVKELRNTLENTEIGTEEFGRALTDLTVKQQELTNVTKSGVAAQKGSYNDLVNQMALLRMEWRATADEGERNAIGAQIAEINSQLKEMDASVGNYQRNVGNYRQELKQLKEDLLSLEEGTEEYSNALARAAEISQKMQDVNEFVAQSAQDMGDHLQNVTGVAAGMVGVFQTVQASLNLIGVESENVEKMIATMQNLMAITQGLTAIEGAIDKYKRLNDTIKGLTIVQNLFNTSKTKGAAASTADAAASTADAAAKGAQTVATTAATKATWSLNSAIAANPLGALLIAITAVVTALVSLVSWMNEAADASEEMSRANDILTDVLQAQNTAIDRNIELWMAQGMSRKEALEKSLADEEENYNKLLDKQSELYAKASKRTGWQNFWGIDPISEEEQAELDRSQELIISQAERIADKKHQIEVESEKEKKQLQDKALADSLSAAEKAAAQRKALLEKEANERKKIIEESWKKVSEIEKKYRDRNDELKFELSLYFKSPEEQEIEKLKRGTQKVIDEITRESQEAQKALEKLLKSKEITGTEYSNRLSKVYGDAATQTINATNILNQKILEVQKTYMKERVEIVDSMLDEEAKSYDYNRDRILRSVMLREKALETIYDRTPKHATEFERLKAEEQMLSGLRNIYEEKIEAFNAQDNLERESVKRMMEAVSLRTATLRQMAQQEDKYLPQEMKLFAEEADMLDAKYAQLKDRLADIGDEAIALAEKYETAGQRLNEIKIEKLTDQLNSAKEQLSSLKDEFSKTMEMIGASDSWNTVFDSVLAGIDATAGALTILGDKTADTKKKIGAIFQIAAAGFQMVSDVLGAVAEEQDETTEKGFEKQKKYQIAQATMQMLAGIVAAWGSAMMLPPPMSWIMGGVMTAATATLGAIQIANIKKQKFDGGGGGEANLSPTLSAVQMMDTGVQPTTNIEGASAESTVTDTRVYVVETDISNSQNNVRTIVAEATF